MKTINDNTTNTACAPMMLGLWWGNRLFAGRCPALMLSGLRPDLRRSAPRNDALRGWFVIVNPKGEATEAKLGAANPENTPQVRGLRAHTVFV